MEDIKKNALARRQEVSITELPNGQFTFIPEMPYEVAKVRGPLIDEVLRQSTADQATLVLEVDDTVESTETPLPIQTRVMLNYDKINIDTDGLFRLNAFDREVVDAVMSLIPYNDVITADMIYRIIIGKRTSRYISDTQLKMVRESLMRCSRAWLQISLTDMYEKDSPIGKLLEKKGIKGRYSEPMLSFKVFRTEIRGRVTERYLITSHPVLFSYAANLGKITIFPIDLVDTKINKTERIIILQSFLLRSIDEMYRHPEIPRFISIYDIYSSIDAMNESRPHQHRIRTNVETILEDWISKKLIVSYSVRHGGRAIKGYELVLEASPPYNPQAALPIR